MFTLLALACVPAQITLGDGSTVRTANPGTTEEDICVQTEGADPSCPHSGNEDEASQHDCTIGSTHQWVILDFEGGFHQDYEPSLAVLVDDGSWYMSENGWLELPTEPRAPLGIRVIDLNSGFVFPPEVIARNTMVTVLDDDYVEVAELIPSTDTTSVQYDCPDPP